jgi:uncharacterized repeat protein (TIGR03803 family)
MCGGSPTVGASSSSQSLRDDEFETHRSLPTAGLLQGPDGTLYGTTDHVGASDHVVIFSLSPGAAFHKSGTDRCFPVGEFLLRASAVRPFASGSRRWHEQFRPGWVVVSDAADH